MRCNAVCLASLYLGGVTFLAVGHHLPAFLRDVWQSRVHQRYAMRLFLAPLVLLAASAVYGVLGVRGPRSGPVVVGVLARHDSGVRTHADLRQPRCLVRPQHNLAGLLDLRLLVRCWNSLFGRPHGAVAQHAVCQWRAARAAGRGPGGPIAVGRTDGRDHCGVPRELRRAAPPGASASAW